MTSQPKRRVAVEVPISNLSRADTLWHFGAGEVHVLAGWRQRAMPAPDAEAGGFAEKGQAEADFFGGFAGEEDGNFDEP